MESLILTAIVFFAAAGILFCRYLGNKRWAAKQQNDADYEAWCAKHLRPYPPGKGKRW